MDVTGATAQNLLLSAKANSKSFAKLLFIKLQREFRMIAQHFTVSQVTSRQLWMQIHRRLIITWQDTHADRLRRWIANCRFKLISANPT